VAEVCGGAGKWEQTKALKEGAEICVATPGRLIEMIKKKTTNMQRFQPAIIIFPEIAFQHYSPLQMHIPCVRRSGQNV
jgi:hypothetical protein